MLKRKLVSGSLSQIKKMCENLKSAIWRLEVAFSINDIGDPSNVYRCVAAGSILVLYWSSTILYKLVCISEIVAPDLIRALNLFPTWTVPFGQSETSSVVNQLVDDCPLHLSESLSLLEEGSSTLKDHIHCMILRKSPIVNPHWWPSSGSEIYEGLLFMDVVLMPSLCTVYGEYGVSVLN